MLHQQVESETAPAEQVTIEKQISIGDRLKSPQTLLSFAVALLFIIFIFRNLNLDLRSIWQNIKTAIPIFLVLGFAAYYVSFPIRALRWNVLLGNAGISRASGFPVPGIRGLTEIYLLSWFANCLVPAKLGDAYRGYLLKKNARPSFSRTLGTVFAERIIDVIALVSLILIASLLVFHGSMPASVQFPILVGIILVSAAVSGLIVLSRFSGHIERRLPLRVKPYYVRTQEGLRTSFSRTGLEIVSLTTVVIWALEGLRVFCVAAAFSVILSPPEAIFVALLASLLTVIPLTPAGLGVVEGGTIVALKLLGVDNTDAATIAIVDRVIAYWSVIVIGMIVYVISKHK